MSRSFLTFTSALIALTQPFTEAASQARMIVPGDGVASGRSIEPYATEWHMTAWSPDGTERSLGRWLDTLDIVTVDGVELLRRVQTTVDTAGVPGNRQLHMVDRATMLPVRSHTSAQLKVKHVDFGPGAIRGFMVIDPEAPFLPIAAEPGQPAYDFDLAGILLLAFRLEPGDTVRFPTHEVVPAGMLNGRPTGIEVVTDTITAVARAAEDVQAGVRLGRRQATPIEVAIGGRTLTFWLGDEPPYVYRLTAETPRGLTSWYLP